MVPQFDLRLWPVRARAAHVLRYCLPTALLCVAAVSGAQGSFCDPTLPVPNGDPYGYRQRGDRCEGRYIREVSGTTLYIGSLVDSSEAFDPASPEPLHLAWSPPPGALVVRLRAQGLKRRLYYRMDTQRPAKSGSYLWPTNLLVKLVQRSDDIGVLATTRVHIAGRERDVSLPVSIGYAQSPRQTAAYRLIVVPGVQLSELLVTVIERGPDGREHKPVRSDEPLQYGYYPAERGIAIELAGLPNPGFYEIKLTARLEGGGAATRELWMYRLARLARP